MLLNVTHNGLSQDFDLGDVTLDDGDVRRVAAEILQVEPATFAVFVIDRMPNNKVYLRPKVPFGA